MNNGVSGAQQSGKADTPSRAANDIADTPTKGPYIDRQASKNVTALLGKTAYLICKVRNLGNKTIGEEPGPYIEGPDYNM
ncbi:hypothetical protein M8J76_012198 [Diaphorina citri]|nr:hypothetical protein M8J76_012198 [Diaphorina citri]